MMSLRCFSVSKGVKALPMQSIAVGRFGVFFSGVFAVFFTEKCHACQCCYIIQGKEFWGEEN